MFIALQEIVCKLAPKFDRYWTSRMIMIHFWEEWSWAIAIIQTLYIDNCTLIYIYYIYIDVDPTCLSAVHDMFVHSWSCTDSSGLGLYLRLWESFYRCHWSFRALGLCGFRNLCCSPYPQGNEAFLLKGHSTVSLSKCLRPYYIRILF